MIAYLEDIEWGDAVYFAIITGFTIGHSDIEPLSTWGYVLSVVIGLVGLSFTGMIIGVADVKVEQRQFGSAYRFCRSRMSWEREQW